MKLEHPTDHQLILIETPDGHKSVCSCGWSVRYWLASAVLARRLWHRHLNNVRYPNKQQQKDI